MVSAIQTAIPTLNSCEAHGGRFGLQDLKHYAKRAPAIVVTNLGGTNTRREGGTKVSDRQWAAFVITKGTSQERRDAQALVLVQELLKLLPDQSGRWGDDNAHIPENIDDDNLFSVELDKQGIALWAVTWTQGYDIEPSTSGLDDFVTLYGTWDMAEQDDQTDMESITTLETT